MITQAPALPADIPYMEFPYRMLAFPKPYSGYSDAGSVIRTSPPAFAFINLLQLNLLSGIGYPEALAFAS